jgi:hypothetical protein
VLLGINTDEDHEALPLRISKDQINWRSWWDGSTTGPITRTWNVHAFPTLHVLDHRGVIRYKAVYGDALDEAIDLLVQEAESEHATTR